MTTLRGGGPCCCPHHPHPPWPAPQASNNLDIYKLANAATAGAGASSAATLAFPSAGQMRNANLIVSDGTSIFLPKINSNNAGVWQSC